MQERVTQRSVTFLHPFTLDRLDGEQSAGTYTIETVEEPIEGLSFLAYRRVSTSIVVISKDTLARQIVLVNPQALEVAEQLDASAGQMTFRPIAPREEVPHGAL